MSRLSGMLAGSLLALSVLPLGAAAESGKSWTIYGGDTANTRFSALTQINRGNVAKLKVAWVAQLGSLEAQESTPLVVGDTLLRHHLRRAPLRLRPQCERWYAEMEVCARKFPPTCSRRLAAGSTIGASPLRAASCFLDGSTATSSRSMRARARSFGRLQVVDYHEGAAITSPPTLVKNLVITGYAGGEYGIRGAITAYDQDTGKQVWRTYTVPAAGERRRGNLEGRLVEIWRWCRMARWLLRPAAQSRLLRGQ